MASISLDDVKRFAEGAKVEIFIHDQEGSDQAPAVKKTIKKVQLCPDSTHLRFYFDDFYFLAVPLASDVSWSNEQWAAFDSESGLTYTFKKVQV
ncbi:hypothetical protein [Neobacillus kokaensis]|uniref:FeS cluster biogenesis domain-containing protein n=1 Tax=Neobacillus kokaensis TaxID=2759023 RepID=A0ABQ3N7U3_9BACI|nr:hypothetical protein [Neobacillus kokaensis]GHI00235.1 hypothetical protein AM1BK_37770 [Neobacillus kokaensis]